MFPSRRLLTFTLAARALHHRVERAQPIAGALWRHVGQVRNSPTAAPEKGCGQQRHSCARCDPCSWRVGKRAMRLLRSVASVAEVSLLSASDARHDQTSCSHTRARAHDFECDVLRYSVFDRGRNCAPQAARPCFPTNSSPHDPHVFDFALGVEDRFTHAAHDHTIFRNRRRLVASMTSLASRQAPVNPTNTVFRNNGWEISVCPRNKQTTNKYV